MAERNSPNGPFVIQANTHNAEVLRQMVQSLVMAAGTVNPADMAITAQGTPNMTVNVAAGFAFLKGTEANRQGTYHVYNDATVIKTISASDPTNPRHDLIVAKVQDADFSGATNTWSLAVVAGTPNASPVDPATPNNAIVLAMVNVRAATASILTSDITDRRVRALINGGVTAARANFRSINYTTTSATATEIDNLTRVTVTVPSSGVVRVMAQIIALTSIAIQDVNIYVQPVGGAWTKMSGYPFDTASVYRPVTGEIWLTGLTPGVTTFALGWSTSGGNTATLPGATRITASDGSFILVEPQP